MGRDGWCRCGKGHGTLGLEPTPELFVTHLVQIFREVKRVLSPTGTLWLVLGDCFVGAGKRRRLLPDLKRKDLAGIPWLVALALRNDGWYLRSDIVWHKPNATPENVNDRPTRAHEFVFLLAKSPRYFYDHAAIAEPAAPPRRHLPFTGAGVRPAPPRNHRLVVNMKGRALPPRGSIPRYVRNDNGIQTYLRNRRSVWTLPTHAYRGAHFATYPPELIRPCIRAGCPVGGVVLDPFMGAGTTGLVALKEGRRFVGIELNPSYLRLATERLNNLSLQAAH